MPYHLLSTDVANKTYMVTGRNSGISLEIVSQLAHQGAHVVLACRRPDEGEQAKSKIMLNRPRGVIELVRLDLADLKSVRTFVDHFFVKHSHLHGLVNNAGVMNPPYGKTKDGFETQIGITHLGHYLLTELLLPCRKASAPARIVILSSCYHDRDMGREGMINLGDLHFERRMYDGWEAYAQSKLANLLHAKELAKRIEGSNVVVVSVHPGWVRINLIRNSAPLWVQNHFLRPALKMAGMLETWEGTQTTLYTLLAPEVASHNGKYFSQKGFYRTKETSKGGWPLHSPNPYAHDDQLAKNLDLLKSRPVLRPYRRTL